MRVGGVAGAGLHSPCSFLPKSFWRNTPEVWIHRALCVANTMEAPGLSRLSASCPLPPSLAPWCNGCRAPWSPRKEAPAPTWAVSPSFSLQLTPLLPSLGFMTCFMSPAWRLPCCHGNQPGAGSWQRNLRLAILSQKPILRKRWGGHPRVGVYGTPRMHGACLPPLL